MLSVKNCRQFLGLESDNLSDREIEVLRDHLYCLATRTVAQFVETQRLAKPVSKSNALDFRAALSSFGDDERGSVEERAAVMEFDGNLPRDEAERAAIALTLRGSDN